MTSAGKLLQIFFFVGFVTNFASSSFSANTKPQLCILKFPQMESLAVLDTSTDRMFTLSFLHSVSLTTVTDVYRVDKDEIIQVSESFSQHGAGLPSQSNDIGVTGWVHSDGLFTIELERKVSPLVIRVQSGYQNKLIQNGHEYRMSDWAIGALLLAPCTAINRMKGVKSG